MYALRSALPVMALALVVVTACNGDDVDGVAPLDDTGRDGVFLQNLARHHDRTLAMVRPALRSGETELEQAAADIRAWIAEELPFILAFLEENPAPPGGDHQLVPDGAARQQEVAQARDRPEDLAALLARHLEAGAQLFAEVALGAGGDPEVADLAESTAARHRQFAERLRQPGS